MTEQKHTCETCPWWVEVEGMVADGEAGDWRQCGECRNGQSEAFRTEPECDFWCSEHPDRKLPDVHGIAGGIAIAIVANDRLRGIAGEAASERDSLADSVARFAYDYADAMLAEAKRRQGGA